MKMLFDDLMKAFQVSKLAIAKILVTASKNEIRFTDDVVSKILEYWELF